MTARPEPAALARVCLPARDRTFADQAFARASGAVSRPGNAIRLLYDAAENYPAWLSAIRAAQRLVLFESYMIEDDAVGREFADALAERARAGVKVCVLYDWLGSHGADALWEALRASGAHVQGFNPPRWRRPLGWISRDHRKTIAIDGRIGYVSGICVSAKWIGDPQRRLEPWRDTGVELRGPAVADLEAAFAQVWNAAGGAPLPDDAFTPAESIASAGDAALRVIAGVPDGTGTYRLDLAIASLARQRLWLTDAYFVGTTAYVQALAAAARDGVDVRLLVPGASDIPAVSPLSRAGYRPLLDAGVRVFEWNGTMLHAKTAVADGLWSRIGSTNLNIASWMQNYELDVAIEDAGAGEAMLERYEADLGHATEIVLTRRNRVQRVAEPATERHARRAMSGSANRAAAGAVSVGSALGAALTNRRALGAAESSVLAKVGIAALVIAVVAALWPRLVAWPLAAIGCWLGIAWLARAAELKREAIHKHEPAAPGDPHPSPGNADES
jgi:cardiolipin synthase